MNAANGMLYTTTSQGCNGVASGVYAMDLTSADRKISYFQTGAPGSGVWGRAGVAVTTDGRVVLMGRVKSPEEKRLMEEMAQRASDKISVDNRLQVVGTGSTSK